MELDRQVLLEKSEVCVCGKNGHLAPHRYSTDEKVGVCTLAPLTATDIMELCGTFEIVGHQFEIGKWTEMIAKLLELGLVFDS
jgi:hypothetical protein